jgi:hypothetical protein
LPWLFWRWGFLKLIAQAGLKLNPFDLSLPSI